MLARMTVFSVTIKIITIGTHISLMAGRYVFMLLSGNWQMAVSQATRLFRGITEADMQAAAPTIRISALKFARTVSLTALTLRRCIRRPSSFVPTFVSGLGLLNGMSFAIVKEQGRG